MDSIVKPRGRVKAGSAPVPSAAEPNRLLPGLPVDGGYMRDTSPGTLAAWIPALREPADVHGSAWQNATARALDAMFNSGWLAGGITQATDAICGPALALNARPVPSIFGSPADAAVWARDVERRFEAWAASAYACDLFARQSLGQLCAQATRMWFGQGEIVGIVRFVKRPGNTHGTKIMVVPARRLLMASSRNDAVQGVIHDQDGAPIAYVFEKRPVEPGKQIEEQVVQARDALGRPQVIHIHDSPPTAIRGITPLTPALRVVRQFDQLANATLTNALIQAIFAATVESPAPTEQLVEMLQSVEEQQTAADATAGPLVGEGAFDRLMQARLGWYQNTKFDLGQVGKIIHLFMGEKLTFHGSQTPNSTYKDFTRFLLREIAKCLGITYEQLTGDREGATYSSERMGSAEAWITTLYRRKHIAGRLMQTAYEAWLEEDIELGNTPFPGGLPAFLANRDAASRADWRGPPKPTADDLKTSKANQIKRAEGIISREMWCAEEGVDWQDVNEQLMREDEAEAEREAARVAAGLPPTAANQVAPEPEPPEDREDG